MQDLRLLREQSGGSSAKIVAVVWNADIKATKLAACGPFSFTFSEPLRRQITALNDQLARDVVASFPELFVRPSPTDADLSEWLLATTMVMQGFGQPGKAAKALGRPFVTMESGTLEAGPTVFSIEKEKLQSLQANIDLLVNKI